MVLSNPSRAVAKQQTTRPNARSSSPPHSPVLDTAAVDDRVADEDDKTKNHDRCGYGGRIAEVKLCHWEPSFPAAQRAFPASIWSMNRLT